MRGQIGVDVDGLSITQTPRLVKTCTASENRYGSDAGMEKNEFKKIDITPEKHRQWAACFRDLPIPFCTFASWIVIHATHLTGTSFRFSSRVIRNSFGSNPKKRAVFARMRKSSLFAPSLQSSCIQNTANRLCSFLVSPKRILSALLSEIHTFDNRLTPCRYVFPPR